MSFLKTVNKYGDFLHSAPLFQLASAGAVAHAGRHGRAFSAVEGAVSCAATGFTAPVWLVKDLALAAIAGIKSLCQYPEEEVKQARALATMSAVNMGIGAAAPVASLAGMGYVCTSYPQQINAQKLPAFLASANAMFKEFNSQYDEFAFLLGGHENVLKLFRWIEKNEKMAVEFVEQIPEAKPFAKLLPTLAPALEKIIAESRDREKFDAMIAKIEQVNTAPFMGLLVATGKNSMALHGRSLSKIDAALTYAATALTSLAHIATNLFLVIIALPVSLFSKQAKAFFITQTAKLSLNFQCFGVGIVGAFSPDTATEWVQDKITETLPKGLFAFLGKVAEISKGNYEGTINDGKAFVAFAKRVIAEKKFPYTQQIVDFAMAKMKDSHQNVERIMELLHLLPGFSEMFPKALAGFAPQLVSFMDKHSLAVQKVVGLVSAGESIVDAVKKAHDDHPLVKEEITTMIPKIVKDSDAVVETALQYAATTPIIQNLLPKHIADDIIPKVPQLLLLHKTHPQVVKQVLVGIVDNKVPHKKTLTDIALSNPALSGVLRKIGLI